MNKKDQFFFLGERGLRLVSKSSFEKDVVGCRVEGDPICIITSSAAEVVCKICLRGNLQHSIALGFRV